jgi:hypothetical protein
MGDNVKKTIIDKLFCVKVIVLYGRPWAELVKVAKQEKIYKHIENEKENAGLSVKIADSKFIVWTETKDFNTLSHELLHVVNDVLLSHNINLSRETEEIYCYYMDFWVREVTT